MPRPALKMVAVCSSETAVMIIGTANHLQKNTSATTQLTQLNSPYSGIQSKLTLSSLEFQKAEMVSLGGICVIIRLMNCDLI